MQPEYANAADSAPSRRIALVIGNSNYLNSPLSSPAIDAKLVSEKLRAMGYRVTERVNMKRDDFLREVRDFASALAATKESTGLFYFSGHGMQVQGVNYLVPVDSDIRSEEDIRFQGVQVTEITARMKASGAALSVLVLDACRNNPYEKSFKSGDAGLAKTYAPTGTFIAFAAEPGAVARQSSGNSPSIYTATLLKRIDSDEAFPQMFQRVANEVSSETGGTQNPYVETSAGLPYKYVLSAAISAKLAKLLSGQEVEGSHYAQNYILTGISLKAKIVGNNRLQLNGIHLQLVPPGNPRSEDYKKHSGKTFAAISTGSEMYLYADVRGVDGKYGFSEGGRICCWQDLGLSRLSAGMDVELPKDHSLTIRLQNGSSFDASTINSLQIWFVTGTYPQPGGGGDGWGISLKEFFKD
jgi:hypothetical protein